MAWYDESVFYHIYPLGLCGCDHENRGKAENHFDKINEWARHAKDIGCNAIYIGPLFESVGHGYETTDYRMVDRRLGTNNDFKQFVKNCHDMGVKVIVDGVFNHTGREFFAFKDIKQYRENSRYKDWYLDVNFWGNNEYNDGFSYQNWGGYNLLAKLNLYNPEVRNYHFDTVKFWISEFDIDGIRLDAADVLDHNFMQELRGVTDGLKRDFWLMGEVIHGQYSQWANPGELHSVTNYELHKGIYSGHNDHNYFEIAHSIERLLGICGDTNLYTFVDNHDVARIYSKINKKEHIYDIFTLLYTVPGIPSIYYGSEFCIEGNKEKHSDWNLRPNLQLSDFSKDNEIIKLITKLGNIRTKYKELAYGSYKKLLLTNRQFAYARVLDGKAVITALNNDDNPVHLDIDVPVSANTAVDLLGTANTSSISQQMDLLGPSGKEALYKENEAQGLLNTLSGLLHSAKDKMLTNTNAEFELGESKNILSRINDMVNEFVWFYGKNEAEAKMKKESSEPIKEEVKYINIKNGKISIDLPANRQALIYVYNE
ncbi:MAG: alpha-amylase family glycosyl hydrolase [Clostridia bacterium]|nr:alpha-amylase family glycosyl hydrolase [Clostridia bacterium]